MKASKTMMKTVAVMALAVAMSSPAMATGGGGTGGSGGNGGGGSTPSASTSGGPGGVGAPGGNSAVDRGPASDVVTGTDGGTFGNTGQAFGGLTSPCPSGQELPVADATKDRACDRHRMGKRSPIAEVTPDPNTPDIVEIRN